MGKNPRGKPCFALLALASAAIVLASCGHVWKEWWGPVIRSNQRIYAQVVARPEADPEKDGPYMLRTEGGKSLRLYTLSAGRVTSADLDRDLQVHARISFPRGSLFLSREGQSVCLNELVQDTYFRPDVVTGTKLADRVSVEPSDRLY